MGFVVAGRDTIPVFEFIEEAFDKVAPTVLLSLVGCWIASVAFGRDDSNRCRRPTFSR